MAGVITFSGAHAESRGRPARGSTRFAGGASLLLTAALFLTGAGIALACRIPVRRVMSSYQYDVLVILIAMELFTNLFAETHVMERLAVRLAVLSRGRRRLCLVLFGTLMFLVSSCLNNITAVMMVLPVIFVMLRTLEADQAWVSRFFAVILALSNTGGAASPIGDFPAIVLLSSGITSFTGYLFRAFPLFALTSAALLAYWGLRTPREMDDGALRALATANLRSQYKYVRVRGDVLAWLGGVFLAMFLAWSIVPQELLPPEIIAVLGYAAGMAVCLLKGVHVELNLNMKSVLTIAAFLFFAQVISQTSLLTAAADWLRANISEPRLLIPAVMLLTSLAAGIFSAGPATAAMLPVITELCSGPLEEMSDWIAVSCAAAICAGSSLFLWSATAGMLLSEKVDRAGLEHEGVHLSWNVKQYFACGLVNYTAQMSIALAAAVLVL